MRIVTLLSLLLIATAAAAQERRAPPPTFSEKQLSEIFFDSLHDAIPGQPPSLSSLRTPTDPPAAISPAPSDAPALDQQGPWDRLVRAETLEDEVKRVKLHLDSTITTPSAFSSGGYQEARVDLTALATLFAVIHQHGAELRWHEHSAAARDLLAATARSCKSGSSQAFGEARRRQADLQDLMSGAGLTERNSQSPPDWSAIADRSPLMEYAEALIKMIEAASNEGDKIANEAGRIRRHAELIAMLGAVLAQSGMEDADDADYVTLSRAMSDAATALAVAAEKEDINQVQSAAASIRQRCDDCHQAYR
jgi:hypothetical protein